MTTVAESTQSRRIDLILREIDSLPTLPAVATRLLTLISNEETSAREVIRLVSSDPPLTAKILTICRKADRGIRGQAMTIDKAVVLLGFNTIRNAVLSIKVFEIFDNLDTGSQTVSAGKHGDSGKIAEAGCHFQRENFWRHSLAVGIAAELIASVHPSFTDLPPSEAFVCGLMHDLGKLALDYVLPKSYARVVERVELTQGNIANVERQIMGVDHHTAGKRLSEQWLLPYWIQDCVWLHGSDFDTLPKLPHRRMIGLITLADLIVRRNHIGYSGNFSLDQDPAEIAQQLGLNAKLVDSITMRLHEELHSRSEALGLNEQPSRELFMQSIQQANQVLGRLNNALNRRTKTAAHQEQVLETITAFHGQASPGRTVQDVFDSVVVSATSVLGAGYYAMIYQLSEVVEEDGTDPAWLICQYNDRGEPVHSQFVNPPDFSPQLSGLMTDPSQSVSLMGVLPWVVDHLRSKQDRQSLQVVALGGGWGTVAAIVHNRPSLPPQTQMQALRATWGSAIAAVIQHEGSRRLSEDLAGVNRDLADANRQLAETQEKLLHTESLARLGEMSAGAAHEMNNPLAVISGRGQLLAKSLSPESKEQLAAKTIVEQSHRLSDLISSMRMFADPPKANLRMTDVAALLDSVVKAVGNVKTAGGKKPISLKCRVDLPPVRLDPDQIGQAVTELLLNAIQSFPKTAVHISAGCDSKSAQLVIKVTDDGKGMDSYTLTHAMDPFFSAKAAGRQIGIGLARAQIYITAHQGTLVLESSSNSGTIVTISIPLDLT